MTWLRAGLAGAVAIAFAGFVWPTPFESWQAGPGRSTRYRRNRLTGDVQRLEEGAGWKSVLEPSPASSPDLQEFPIHALARVTLSGTWSDSEIRFRVRNESAWTLDQLHVDAWTYNPG